MIVGIVGSREYTNYDEFCDHVDYFVEKYGEITKIVSGGAPGTDTLAEKYAKDGKIKKKIYNANWSKYGKAAGPIRNQKIVDESDII